MIFFKFIIFINDTDLVIQKDFHHPNPLTIELTALLEYLTPSVCSIRPKLSLNTLMVER